MDTAADIVAQLATRQPRWHPRRGPPLARRQRGDTGEQPRHRLRIFDSAYRKGALSRILDRGADVVGLGAAESLQVDIYVDKQNPLPRAEGTPTMHFLPTPRIRSQSVTLRPPPPLASA